MFTFLPGSIDVPAACALTRAVDLGFTPTTVRISTLRGEPIELPHDDDVWDAVVATPEVITLGLESGLLQPAANWAWSNTSVQFWLSGVRPTDTLLHGLLGSAGVLGGASGDATDARWQGETVINHYRMWFDKPWEDLPRVTDKWGEEVIDVSRNPGRITDVPGMRLWAAQDVWFGPASTLTIAYDAIPTLPVGHVTDLGEGRWHVRLWEDGTPLEEVRKAQQALRDHLGYEEAVARVDEIRAALVERAR